MTLKPNMGVGADLSRPFLVWQPLGTGLKLIVGSFLHVELTSTLMEIDDLNPMKTLSSLPSRLVYTFSRALLSG